MAGQFTNFGLTTSAAPNQFSFSTPVSMGLPPTAYVTYPAIPAANVQAMGYPPGAAAFSPQQAPGAYNYAMAGWPSPGIPTITTFYTPTEMAAPVYNTTVPSSGLPTNSFATNMQANKHTIGSHFGRPPTILGLKRQNAAPIFQQPASVLTTLTGPEINCTTGNNNTNSSQGKGHHKRPFNANPMAKQQRAIFCDVCKISCAGQLTYKEHIEGQRHKKKVTQMEKGAEEGLARNKITYKCEVCGVVCPGNDTYQAHIKGSKHQRALKVHLNMGKPLTSTEPTIITPRGVIRKASVKDDSSKSKDNSTTTEERSQTISDVIAMYEKDIEPVGADYIDVHGEGKAITYHCKLCDCRFNDPNAKDAHLKGRRHRMQFKRKVDPSIEVDSKFNPRDKRSTRIETSSNMHSFALPPLFGRINFAQNSPSFGDKYLYVAHEALKMTDQEMLAVDKSVTNAETALKLVSDNFTQKNPDAVKVENDTSDPDATPDDRLLKGVMRVGDLAKQIMIRGQLSVELVILCSCKPTSEILHEVGQLLPVHLADVTEEKFEVRIMEQNACIVLVNENEPKVEITMSLTSVTMRDAQEEDLDVNKQQVAIEQSNILDKKMCLEALANLRRAKWFQAQCLPHPAALIVLRILKDFRRRTPAWHFLPQWPLELLVERIFAAAGYNLSPSQAFRHVFETVSSGLLFDDCNGLLDPCEKEKVNVVSCLSSQQLEDLTFSAQRVLRLIAFGKLHDVLNVPEKPTGQSRKRSLASTSSEPHIIESKKPRI